MEPTDQPQGQPQAVSSDTPNTPPPADALLLLPSPVALRPSLLRDSIILAVALIFLGVLLFPFSPEASEEATGGKASAAALSASNPFSGLELSAQSAIVLDASTGEVLFERNADETRPLASLTKIMTAVTALSLTPDYTVIRIRPEFLKQEGDTGLFVDERWKLSDLLEFTLITSSNDGATAVASVVGAISLGNDDTEAGREAFIEKMNTTAMTLGLLSLRFSNETGLDESSETSGAYGTARDVAKLFAHAVKTHSFLFEATGEGETTLYSLNDIAHHATNTNIAVNGIPMLVGSKTGFTDLAGGNLVVAFDAGPARPIIIVVLGSTIDGRFSDATALSSAALKRITHNNP